MSYEDDLIHRTGGFAGKDNERTELTKLTDPSRTSIRTTDTGSIRINTRQGDNPEVIVTEINLQPFTPEKCVWSYDYHPLKRDGSGALVSDSISYAGYTAPNFTYDGGTKTRRKGLKFSADGNSVMLAVGESVFGTETNPRKAIALPGRWYTKRHIVTWGISSLVLNTATGGYIETSLNWANFDRKKILPEQSPLSTHAPVEFPKSSAQVVMAACRSVGPTAGACLRYFEAKADGTGRFYIVDRDPVTQTVVSSVSIPTTFSGDTLGAIYEAAWDAEGKRLAVLYSATAAGASTSEQRAGVFTVSSPDAGGISFSFAAASNPIAKDTYNYTPFDTGLQSSGAFNFTKSFNGPWACETTLVNTSTGAVTTNPDTVIEDEDSYSGTKTRSQGWDITEEQSLTLSSIGFTRTGKVCFFVVKPRSISRTSNDYTQDVTGNKHVFNKGTGNYTGSGYARTYSVQQAYTQSSSVVTTNSSTTTRAFGKEAYLVVDGAVAWSLSNMATSSSGGGETVTYSVDTSTTYSITNSPAYFKSVTQTITTVRHTDHSTNEDGASNGEAIYAMTADYYDGAFVAGVNHPKKGSAGSSSSRTGTTTVQTWADGAGWSTTSTDDSIPAVSTPASGAPPDFQRDIIVIRQSGGMWNAVATKSSTDSALTLPQLSCGWCPHGKSLLAADISAGVAHGYFYKGGQWKTFVLNPDEPAPAFAEYKNPGVLYQISPFA